MTNEEFQILVLEKLGNLEIGQSNLVEGQKRLEQRQEKLELRQGKLEERQGRLEERQGKLEENQKNLAENQNDLTERQKILEDGQKEILIKLEGVIEQTAYLTEFRHEVKQELAEIKSNISRIEIATADNWSDIARLKAVR